MVVKVYILIKRGDFPCVIYSYCPGDQNVHSRCGPESETLVGVICGEF